MKTLLRCIALGGALFMSGQALAALPNIDEPTGPVLLDLDGTAIGTGYQHYTVSFTAAQGTNSTDLGFAFRDDAAFLSLDNVSLTANSAPGTNLVFNGDFEQGTVGSSAVGWNYQNPFNAAFFGVVQANAGVGQSNGWEDGAIGAYDTLYQNVATVGGTAYTLSFDLWEIGVEIPGYPTVFSRLNTSNDPNLIGNGVATVVVSRWEGEVDPGQLQRVLGKAPGTVLSVEKPDFADV